MNFLAFKHYFGLNNDDDHHHGNKSIHDDNDNDNDKNKSKNENSNFSSSPTTTTKNKSSARRRHEELKTNRGWMNSAVCLLFHYSSFITCLQYVMDMMGYLPQSWILWIVGGGGGGDASHVLLLSQVYTHLVIQPYGVLSMTHLLFSSIIVPLSHLISFVSHRLTTRSQSERSSSSLSPKKNSVEKSTFPWKKLSYHVIMVITLIGLYHTTHPSDPLKMYASVSNDPRLFWGTMRHPTISYMSYPSSVVKMNNDDDDGNDKVSVRSSSGQSNDGGISLKVIQMSDIHLGSHMSVQRLTEIAESVVQLYDREMNGEQNGENNGETEGASGKNVFVLLTGDFYTFGSHMETRALVQGLSPLKRLKNKVFACLGNHDHEVLESVVTQLEELGVKLLVDESVSVPLHHQGQFVEIVGLDYVQGPVGDPRKHIQDFFHSKLFSKMEKKQQTEESGPHGADGPEDEHVKKHVARLVLLHNPAYFQHIPHRDNDIPTFVFSGHLHSGQFSLRSFLGESLRSQLPGTIVSLTTGWPDHGWFCFHREASSLSSSSSSETATNDVNNGGKVLVKRASSSVMDTCAPNRLLYAHSGTGFYGLPLRIGTEDELPWVMDLFVQTKRDEHPIN